jgi:hypothetical protein
MLPTFNKSTWPPAAASTAKGPDRKRSYSTLAPYLVKAWS